MYNPIAVSSYGQSRQQEIARDAESYWQAQLVRESRGQTNAFNPPTHRSTPLRRVAHTLTALFH